MPCSHPFCGLGRPALLSLVLGLGACAPSLEPKLVRLDPTGARQLELPLALAPFEVTHRPSPAQLRRLGDGSAVLREVVRQAMLEAGLSVIESDQVDEGVRRTFGGGQPRTRSQAVALGRELGAATVGLGVVRDWHQGGIFGRSSAVELELELVDVRSGTSLGIVSFRETGGPDDPARIGRRLARRLTAAVVRDLGDCPACRDEVPARTGDIAPAGR